MEISEFTVRLLLLFFPGVICAYLVDALTVHRPRQPIFFLLQSFTMGLSSYFFYWLSCVVLNHCLPSKCTFEVVILSALVDKTITVSFREVGLVTILAVGLGLLITVSAKYKLLYRITHLFRLTNKFGEFDVWGYTMNLKQVHWVTVRDHKKNLVYDGWVQAFSDDSQNAEMLLRDVSIYKNNSGEKLYQIGGDLPPFSVPLTMLESGVLFVRFSCCC
jgi:hypothetical protein